jgi:hypothetical protein
MSPREKAEAAWVLVKEERCTIKKTVELATVSKRNVSIMRDTWKKLKEKEPETARDYTWAQALMWKRGQAPAAPEDDWKEREAQKIVDALLSKKVAGILLKNPDITAIALTRLDPNLPAALMYEWGPDLPEVVEDLSAGTYRGEGPAEF